MITGNVAHLALGIIVLSYSIRKIYDYGTIVTGSRQMCIVL